MQSSNEAKQKTSTRTSWDSFISSDTIFQGCSRRNFRAAYSDQSQKSRIPAGRPPIGERANKKKQNLVDNVKINFENAKPH